MVVPHERVVRAKLLGWDRHVYAGRETFEFLWSWLGRVRSEGEGVWQGVPVDAAVECLPSCWVIQLRAMYVVAPSGALCVAPVWISDVLGGAVPSRQEFSAEAVL